MVELFAEQVAVADSDALTDTRGLLEGVAEADGECVRLTEPVSDRDTSGEPDVIDEAVIEELPDEDRVMRRVVGETDPLPVDDFEDDEDPDKMGTGLVPTVIVNGLVPADESVGRLVTEEDPDELLTPDAVLEESGEFDDDEIAILDADPDSVAVILVELVTVKRGENVLTVEPVEPTDMLNRGVFDLEGEPVEDEEADGLFETRVEDVTFAVIDELPDIDGDADEDSVT